MSKFCMQCGKEIEDSADICTFCGAAQGGGVTSGGTDTVKNTNKAVAVIIAAASVILVILIVLVNLLFGGGGYKKPVDNMVKAMETGKGKYLYKAMPEFLIEYQYEDEKKSDIYDDLDESMELITGMLEEEYGDDIKISYKIKDKDKIDKDDLEDLEDSIKDKYDEKVRVSKGYEL